MNHGLSLSTDMKQSGIVAQDSTQLRINHGLQLSPARNNQESSLRTQVKNESWIITQHRRESIRVHHSELNKYHKKQSRIIKFNSERIYHRLQLSSDKKQSGIITQDETQ